MKVSEMITQTSFSKGLLAIIGIIAVAISLPVTLFVVQQQQDTRQQAQTNSCSGVTCPVGQFCQDGSCRLGDYPGKEQYGCKTNADCGAADLVCQNKICVAAQQAPQQPQSPNNPQQPGGNGGQLPAGGQNPQSPQQPGGGNQSTNFAIKLTCSGNSASPVNWAVSGGPSGQSKTLIVMINGELRINEAWTGSKSGVGPTGSYTAQILGTAEEASANNSLTSCTKGDEVGTNNQGGQSSGDLKDATISLKFEDADKIVDLNQTIKILIELKPTNKDFNVKIVKIPENGTETTIYEGAMRGSTYIAERATTAGTYTYKATITGVANTTTTAK